MGQIKTQEKTNEITAIPELLEWLDVRGAAVTIDAMGCQKAIAEKIIDKGGDYLLALKGNQSRLHDDVRLHFEEPSPQASTRMGHAETVDKGQGASKFGTAVPVRILTGSRDCTPNGKIWAALLQ